MSRTSQILFLLLALLGAAAVSLAHNGSLVVAGIVDDIVVDGDLRDWPPYLPRYPISTSTEQPPVDEKDLTAGFQVALIQRTTVCYWLSKS
jgi:hypothetical protein